MTGLHHTFKAPPFKWLLIGLVLALAISGAGAIRLAWPVVPRQALVGSYHRASPFLLPVGGTPATLALCADGTLLLEGDAPGLPFHGTWTWDTQERIVRTDNPLWDRRIRLRSTITGPRLSMRICGTPFSKDDEERDEEVDYIKTTPSGD